MQPISARVQTWLKKSPLPAQDLPENQKMLVPQGRRYKATQVKDRQAGHLQIELGYGAGDWWIFPRHWDLSPILLQEGIALTLPQLRIIYPWTSPSVLSEYLVHLNYYLPQYQITTRPRIQMFLAQIGHESGGLEFTEEIASGHAYEGRRDLGNTQPGDGPKFKGRGLIQLTGRANYQSASRHTGLDLVANPELVSTPRLGTQLACWFWQSRGLNYVADANNEDAFRRITRRINGGYNGYEDRLAYWRRTIRAI